MKPSRALGQRMKAVREAVGFTLAEAAKVVGRSMTHYAKIESGIAGYSEDVMARFCQAFCEAPDLLRLYVERGGKMPPVGAPDIRELQQAAGEGLRVVGRANLVETPVVGLAQAAAYEPALEPLSEFLGTQSDETCAWVDAKPNYFTVYVEGDSMEPVLRDGMAILVAGGEYPRRGDLVVAKLSDGQVVVKRYQRKNNVVRLESINPTGQSFEWSIKEQPAFVSWMWPVMAAKLDLRKHRALNDPQELGS